MYYFYKTNLLCKPQLIIGLCNQNTSEIKLEMFLRQFSRKLTINRIPMSILPYVAILGVFRNGCWLLSCLRAVSLAGRYNPVIFTQPSLPLAGRRFRGWKFSGTTFGPFWASLRPLPPLPHSPQPSLHPLSARQWALRACAVPSRAGTHGPPPGQCHW